MDKGCNVNDKVSTLIAKRSLRESASAIEGLGFSSAQKCILTVDSIALRLWNTQKQIKSLHRNDDFGKLMKNIYIEKINCFMLLFSCKEADVTGGDLQLWHPSLSLVQQTKLEYRPLRHCCISPKNESLVLIDSDRRFIVLFLETVPQPPLQKQSLPFSKESNLTSTIIPNINSGNFTSEESGISMSTYRKGIHLKISETQTFIEDFDSKDVQVLQFLDETLMVVIALKQFIVYTRAPPTKNLKFKMTGENTHVLQGEETMFSRMRVLDFLSTIPPSATCLQRVFKDILVIGFSDGTVSVFNCDLLSTDMLRRNAKIVTTFQALKIKSPLNSTVGVASLTVCPWPTISGSSYAFELITSGEDHCLCHWGVRNNYEEDHPQSQQRSKASMSWVTDLLGRQKMAIEPSSIAKKKIYKHTAYYYPKFIHTFFSSNSTSDSKIILCSYGGLLNFTEIRQPQCDVVAFKSEIVYATPGPSPDIILEGNERSDLNEVTEPSDSFPFTDEERHDNCIAVLTDQVIELTSTETGHIVNRLYTTHLQEQVDPAANLSRLIHSANKLNKISQHNAQLQNTRWLEGQPTCIHWCESTKHVAVGFSSGGVGLVAAVRGGDIKYGNIQLNTRSVHENPIVMMKSFTIPSKLDSGNGMKTILLIGDSSGAISTWQIDPRKYEGICWSGRTHQGAIIKAEVINIDENKLSDNSPAKDIENILIVTGCSAGIVKAWSITTTGIMSIVGYVSVGKGMSALAVADFVGLQSRAITRNIPVKERRNSTLRTLGMEAAGELNSTQNAEDREKSLMEDSLDYNSTISSDTKDFPIGTESGIIAASNSNSQATGESVVLLVCVCGFSSGLMESWNLSSRKDTPAALEASASLHIHYHPVTSIQNIAASLCPSPFHRLVLSLSLDGSAFMSEVGDNGVFIKLKYFSVNAPAYSMFLRTRFAESFPAPSSSSVSSSNESTTNSYSVEMVISSDKDIARVLVLASAIPKQWRNSQEYCVKREDPAENKTFTFSQSFSPIDIPTSLVDLLGGDSPDDLAGTASGGEFATATAIVQGPPVLSDISEGVASVGSEATVDKPKDASEGGVNEKNNAQTESTVISLISSEADTNSLAESSLQYDIEGIISNPKVRSKLFEKLHFAKKDSKLLELFQQHEDQRFGTIKTEAVALLLEKWIAVGTMSRATIASLLELLDISSVDSLTFYDVAKLAASLATVLNFNPGTSMNSKVIKNRITKAYRDMNTTKTIVRFNAMGEKVVEKIPLGQLAFGILDGYVSSIKVLWSHLPSRVTTHVNEAPSQGIFPSTRLKHLPGKFIPLLTIDVSSLPKEWAPNSDHWFDLRRTVRVARTILEMRLASQQEFVLRHGVGPLEKLTYLNEVQDLSEIVVRYFELNYGTSKLNVAHQKILHFLEACLQYSEYPLLNFLKRFLCPEEQSDILPDSCLWCFVEALSFMRSRGMIAQGDTIPCYDPMGNLSSTESISSTGSAMSVHWQIVKRSDALLCVEEMLRKRGGFGTRVIATVQESVYALRSTNYSLDSNINGHNDYIDLDSVLELLAVELNQTENYIYNLSKSLFEDWAIPPTMDALARSISRDAAEPIWQNVDFAAETNMKYELLDKLDKLRDFVLKFIEKDTQRTGAVDYECFKAVVFDAGLNVLGAKYTSTLDRFVEVCVRNYSDPIDESVGYVDVWAALLAHLIQTQGMGNFGCEEALEAVQTVRRGIEQNQTIALTAFLGHVQCPERNDPLWTCGRSNNLNRRQSFTQNPPQTTSSTAVPSSYVLRAPRSVDVRNTGLSLDGVWRPISSLYLPTVGPGALTITGMELEKDDASIAMSVESGASFWERQRRRNHKGLSSTVYLSQTGNINNQPIKKPPLHPKDLTSDIVIDGTTSGPSVAAELPIATFLPQPIVSNGGDEDSSVFPNSIVSSLHQSSTSAILASSTGLIQKNPSPLQGTLKEASVLESVLNESDPSDALIHSVAQSLSRGMDRSQRLTGDRSAGGSSRPIDEATQIYVRFPYVEPLRAAMSIDGTPISAEDSDLELRVLEFRERIRRPVSERGKDSLVGRYNASGRSQSPVLPTENYDIDTIRERERIHNYRKDRIKGILGDHLSSKLNKLHGSALAANGTDTSPQARKRQNYAQVLDEMQDRLADKIAKDMEDDRQERIERDHITASIDNSKQMEKARKNEMKRLKNEALRKAHEADLEKEARKKRLEEAQEKKKADTLAKRAADKDASAKKIQDEKERLARQRAKRIARELAAADKGRELAELYLMREEEELSFVVEFELSLKEKEEKEKALKSFIEEQALRNTERQRGIHEAESRYRLLSMHQEYEETCLMQLNDINANINIAPAPVQTPKQLAEMKRGRSSRSLFKSLSVSLDEDDKQQSDDIIFESDEIEEESKDADEEEAEDLSTVEDSIPYEDMFKREYETDDFDGIGRSRTPTADKRNNKKPNAADMSLVQRKLQAFMDRMIEASNGNKYHPRKGEQKDKGSFFMPLTFGSDIVFDPFNSQQYSGSGVSNGAVDEKEDDIVVNTRDFADITDSIKLRQKNDTEVLQNQLYRTSKDDFPAALWTKLVRVDRVDWAKFFQDQGHLAINLTTPTADTSENDFLETMAKIRASKSKLSPAVRASSAKKPSIVDGVDARYDFKNALAISKSEAEKIVPLPFGKVVHSSVEPDAYRFYQIEMPDASSLLTVELKSRKGAADLYLAKDNLATAVEYDYKALCDPIMKPQATVFGGSGSTTATTPSVQRYRIARIVIKPDEGHNPVKSSEGCTFIIGVHGGDTGAMFTLWAFASASPSAVIRGPVSDKNVINELRLLSYSTEEDLLNNFSKVSDEATNKAELSRQQEEIKTSKSGLPNALKSFSDIERKFCTDDATQPKPTLAFTEDDALLETFVGRAGRTILRREREKEIRVRTIAVQEDYNDERAKEMAYKSIDPNLHSDLFFAPALKSFPSPSGSPRTSSSFENFENENQRGLTPIMSSMERVANYMALQQGATSGSGNLGKEPLSDFLKSADIAMQIWTNKPITSFENSGKHGNSSKNISVVKSPSAMKKSTSGNVGIKGVMNKSRNAHSQSSLPSLRHKTAELPFDVTAPAVLQSNMGIFVNKNNNSSYGLPALNAPPPGIKNAQRRK